MNAPFYLAKSTFYIIDNDNRYHNYKTSW